MIQMPIFKFSSKNRKCLGRLRVSPPFQGINNLYFSLSVFFAVYKYFFKKRLNFDELS